MRYTIVAQDQCITSRKNSCNTLKPNSSQSHCNRRKLVTLLGYDRQYLQHDRVYQYIHLSICCTFNLSCKENFLEKRLPRVLQNREDIIVKNHVEIIYIQIDAESRTDKNTLLKTLEKLNIARTAR